ncbi:MAG: hypothetical protein IPI43_26970 [Sandaracinaceae bacterium]|nr:hypothetical protein [Sandaracinaceae bacterium]
MPRCLPTIIAAFLVACGTPTYTEGTYAMATESLDEWIARADEPLRSELAAHRAEFDRRMTALPTDPAARSAAIGDIYTEAMETRSTYQGASSTTFARAPVPRSRRRGSSATGRTTTIA